MLVEGETALFFHTTVRGAVEAEIFSLQSTGRRNFSLFEKVREALLIVSLF